jgi:hypothetical protein
MLFSDFVFMKFNRALLGVEYGKKDKFQRKIFKKQSNFIVGVYLRIQKLN